MFESLCHKVWNRVRWVNVRECMNVCETMTKKKVQIEACNTYRNSDAVKSVLEIVHVTAYSRKSINLKLHTVCQTLMTGNGSVYKRTTSRRHAPCGKMLCDEVYGARSQVHGRIYALC